MLQKSSILRWYALALVVSVALALLLPTSPITLHRLHISLIEYRVTIVTLIVPYAVIWFSAFFAYDVLQQYANKIRSTREGRAFQRVAKGICILAWALVIETLTSIVLGALVASRPSLHSLPAIVDNYTTLALTLAAFIVIGNGTRRLTDIYNIRPGHYGIRAMFLIYTIGSVFFSYFMILNAQKPYSMPVLLLVITIIIPYLYAWCVGMLAVYELRLHAQRVKGVLYQQSLNWLGSGLTIVIIASIMSQYLSRAFGGDSNVSFGTLLGLVYFLLIIQAIGYSLVAVGSRRLRRIEEV